ncbi:glycosyltransferase family 39 protein [Atopobium minutum]|uniref:glycosyltransferase family 39 protein n=1 Tax=Atopobium minutum TaxID=1381 RepID=UPI00290F2151|nr:glycosyltransferase family 39 protein [Atopobium minutum]MDU5130501.1 glycosyltransferase family 39 protein [Atopobium minutum]
MKQLIAWIKQHRAAVLFVAVFVVGIAINALDVAHGQIWFDESYSVALATKSFPDIWRIGAADVHPVLYYCMLRVVYLIFGKSILAMRLFSLVGTAVLGLLGWTHIRKDYDNVTAILFTFFVLMSPWGMQESVDVRMYSWAAVFTMLVLIYTRRICLGLLTQEGFKGIPTSWWLFAFGFALASAYTHYYSAIGAFVCMAVLLITIEYELAIKSQGARKALRSFMLGAVVCLLAYAPWIHAMMSQVKGVSQEYWIEFYFPQTLLEFIEFPIRSVAIDGIIKSQNLDLEVLIPRIAFFVLMILIVIALAVYIKDLVRAKKTHHMLSTQLQRSCSIVSLSGALSMPLLLLYGTILLSAGLSLAIHQSIMQARYLSCIAGAACLALAVLFAKLIEDGASSAHAGSTQDTAVSNDAAAAWDKAPLGKGLFTKKVLLGVAILSYAILGGANQLQICKASYDWRNWAVVDYYRDVVHTDGGSLLPVYSEGNIGSNIVAAAPLSIYVPESTILIPTKMRAYEAYTPSIELVDDVAAHAKEQHGRMIYIGNGSDDQAAQEFARKIGASVVESKTFWRPYKSNMWTISILERP